MYFALFNNNIIDIHHFTEKDAGENELAIQEAFEEKQAEVFAKITEQLLETRTPYNKLSEEYQVYQSYIVNMNHIARLDGINHSFFLFSKDEVLISRRMYAEAFEKYKAFMEIKSNM